MNSLTRVVRAGDWILLLYVFAGCSTGSSNSTIGNLSNDPLPSWSEGRIKESIVDYVERITDSASSDFVPVKNRIATFDNDGTLWAERPYVQELFAFYRVKEMVKKDPGLARQQPFKAVLENDKAYFEKQPEQSILKLILATHTGVSENEFESSVHDFFLKTTYPLFGKVSLKQIVYTPQIELLNYLRANHFQIFICTGGTIEFVRGMSEELYGVPKDHVIGTTFKYEFIRSARTVMALPEVMHLNDKALKPAAIHEHIGQRPVFACGNEGGAGDIAMLEYCQGNKYASFQLMINHDDSAREFYYQEKDSASLKAAVKNSWHVVSMKNDWNKIFSGDQLTADNEKH